ncbi:uncharacterized protein LTHEOB_12502 [Neofusicoccum parvum]|nr:uncharacterized protein LTHEOB_12502 [Neofusicoccum parvum]
MDDRAPAAANYTPLAGLDRLSLDGNTRTADNELYQPLSPLEPRDVDDADAASSHISSMDSARPRATTSLEEGAQRPPATRQPASQAPLLDVPGHGGGQSASAVTLVGVEGAAKEGEEAAAPGVTEPRWTPFHLRRPVLLAAAAVFVLMVVALEVLRYVSERDDGLATVSENMHYLWTYGPTAVLTVLAALWGRVEYRSKQIMPWSLMARGRTSMEHGLLLNYMTSTTLGSLYRSVKRRHFLVSIGICGSLILRLLIIFSTGLLSLEYRPMVYDKEFFALDTLDLAKEVEYIEWLTDEFRPLSNGINFWAILNYNLSHPHGTTSEYAVQSFVPYDNETYDTMAADVQVFEAKLGNCESFNFTFERPSDSVEYFDIGLKRVLPKELWDEWEPWCYLSHSTYGLTNSVADGLLHELRDLMEIIYKCSNSTPPEDQEHRIFVTLESTLTGNETEMSGVISGNGDKLNITTEVKEELDLGIQPLNITAKLLTSMGDEYPKEVVDFGANTNIWFSLLNASEPQSNISDFRNTSLVAELSQRIWPSFAALAVKNDYKNPENETLSGTVTSSKGRLCIQELSLRLMEALLAVLTLLSIALCFLSPGIFHRDPGSVGAQALILARSPDLMGLLSGYGSSTKQALKSRLSGYIAYFPMRNSPENPAIEVTPKDPTKSTTAKPAEPDEDNSDQSKWWHPIPTMWWFRICIILLALAVIIVLEVLFRLSGKNSGLADVDTNGYQKYTWTYIPTLAMASIGLAFAMADSTARTLHPFQVLHRGSASFKEILYDPAGQISLVAVVQAASKRHFPLMAIMFTGLLAPILTIVTSGLYIPVPVPWTRDVTLQMQDWFDIDNRTVDTLQSIAEENKPWSVFSLTQFSNMSSPQWTHGEYAFPTFSAGDLRGHNGSETSLSMSLRVPAVRGNLNCSLTNYYENKNTSYDLGRLIGSPTIIVVDPPEGCHTPEINGTERRLYLKPSDSLKDGYFAAFMADDYDTVSLALYKEYIEDTSSIQICGDNRQHFWFAAGHQSGDISDSLTLLHCVPYIEALYVTANFSLPSLQLSTSAPVSPHEDTAIPLSTSSSATAFPDAKFDKFVAALANGTHGTPLASLAGQPNTAAFRAAIQRLYALYAAQNLHFNYRRPLSDPLPAANSTNNPAAAALASAPATGTLTDSTRLRLVQSGVSTRVLEGLLAAMVLCAGAAFALERRTRILPKDPGCVAAVMALVAEGEVWRRVVPVGAERWGDGEVERRGVFAGWLFSLGWWGGEGERRRFGVDVGRAEGG